MLPQARIPKAATEYALPGSTKRGPSIEANFPCSEVTTNYHGIEFDRKPRETTALVSDHWAATSMSHAAGGDSLCQGPYRVPFNSTSKGGSSAWENYDRCVICTCKDDSSCFHDCICGGFDGMDRKKSADMAGKSTPLTLSSDLPYLEALPQKCRFPNLDFEVSQRSAERPVCEASPQPDLRLLPPQARIQSTAATWGARQGKAEPGPLQASLPDSDMMKKHHAMKYEPKPMDHVDTALLRSGHWTTAGKSHAAGSGKPCQSSYHVHVLNRVSTGEKTDDGCSRKHNSSFYDGSYGNFDCTDTWLTAGTAGKSTLLHDDTFPNSATSGGVPGATQIETLVGESSHVTHGSYWTASVGMDVNICEWIVMLEGDSSNQGSLELDRWEPPAPPAAPSLPAPPPPIIPSRLTPLWLLVLAIGASLLVYLCHCANLALSRLVLRKYWTGLAALLVLLRLMRSSSRSSYSSSFWLGLSLLIGAPGADAQVAPPSSDLRP